MSITKLTDSACRCLKDQCFTDSTIYINYRRHWNGFLKATEADAEFSSQIVSDYLIRKYSRNLLLEGPSALPLKEYRIRHAFHSLIYFYNFQSMPGTSMASAVVRIKLSEFDDLCLTSYIDHVKDLDYSQNSLKYGYNTIHNYLVTYPLADICDSHLLDYFKSLSRLSKQTARSMMKVLKRFLCYCHEMSFIGLDYSLLFPSNKLRSYTEIPSVYTPGEVFQLLEYIRNSGRANKRRNYAIAVLISVYGLRARDIMKMKLSDIDWENETIRIVQSKTKQLLIHKLTRHTGNALADYQLDERPGGKSENVFLKSDGFEISAVTISTMIFMAFTNSGININGRKHGSHSLRHSLASNMLSIDTSILAISKTLGHVCVDTTRIYSKVDVNHLRLCGLEVPHYE
ncbi:MAG: tyrosine-type recombinase/integrase [Desulfosporosinus sp.]|nr:tyrosine-type recombinase/integrase [Desulfosporosinus sp.]